MPSRLDYDNNCEKFMKIAKLLKITRISGHLLVLDQNNNFIGTITEATRAIFNFVILKGHLL